MYFRDTNTVAAVNKNRKPIKTIGFCAPLTSMSWMGKDTKRKFDDYRTTVRRQLDNGSPVWPLGNGEVFWRPLDNPPATRHQVFSAPNIKALASCNGNVGNFLRLSGNLSTRITRFSAS